MRPWIVILILFTLTQLKSSQCDVACRYLAYSSGFYEKGACKCVSEKPYEELVRREIIAIPKRSKPRAIDADLVEPKASE